MSLFRRSRARHPVLESLETREVMTAPIPADFGAVTNQALQDFAFAFNSRQGSSRYNANLDTNHNGFIGQGDVNPFLKSLELQTPKIPLNVRISLVPGDLVVGAPKNSGGATYKSTVTVVGQTTPNSIVFVDSALGNYKFNGSALAADSKGYFSYVTNLKIGLTNTEYLVRDPYGHQKIFAYPIIRLPFASSHT